MVSRMVPDFGGCASDRRTTSRDHFNIGFGVVVVNYIRH